MTKLRAIACHSGLASPSVRSEEHTSELQSQSNLVCRLLLEKKKYAGLFRGPSERCLSESLLEGETALSSGNHESLVFGWVTLGLRDLLLHVISNAILH